MYEILTDQLCSTPTRIEIEFLTQLNENKNCSTIAEMACWGNQLYIVDSGRHKVYLTDLVGNIRKSVGKEKSINAGEFTKPSAICVDSVGNFIVADSQRLQDWVQELFHMEGISAHIFNFYFFITLAAVVSTGKVCIIFVPRTLIFEARFVSIVWFNSPPWSLLEPAKFALFTKSPGFAITAQITHCLTIFSSIHHDLANAVSRYKSSYYK